jgi:hypothetical protein
MPRISAAQQKLDDRTARPKKEESINAQDEIARWLGRRLKAAMAETAAPKQRAAQKIA